MSIQSLHAPHKGVALLWEPDNTASIEVHNNILRSIDACHAFQVPVLVMHCWQGHHYTFSREALDYRYFDSIVAYAQDKGICIALENLEGEEYLEALLTRYLDQRHVGFCWDTGHDHCYPHRTDFLASYGSRLMMTHLNDNWGLRDPAGIPSGKDDLHLLPGDGNMDWEHTLEKLKNAPRQEILNFELKIRPRAAQPQDLPYLHFSPEEFIKLAGQRAQRIAQQYDTLKIHIPMEIQKLEDQII